MAHTPGPWSQGKRGAILGHFYPARPDGGFWAEVCRVELQHSDKSGEANAALIIAAPDLLEACEAYAHAVGMEEMTKAGQMVAAAIAKAGGDQL